jgi:uncharacterized membrane protein
VVSASSESFAAVVSESDKKRPSSEWEYLHGMIQFKTLYCLLIMVIVGPVGNVLLSHGMKHVAAPAAWTVATVGGTAASVLGSWSIWFGFGCLVTYLVAEMVVLSWADYSYVQPASAVQYGVVTWLGSVLLGEGVSHTHWAGVCVICLGILLVGRTSARTTRMGPP